MAAFTVIDHQKAGSGGLSVWSKSSIPSSYEHLLIKASIRTSKSGVYDNLDFQLGNGSLDTGTNYSMTNCQAFNNNAPNAGHGSGMTSIWYNYVSANNATADTFGTVKIWIPNYANTTGYKQVFCASAIENASTSSHGMMFTAGLWQSTSAIDVVGITETGDDFMEHSTFTLYGLTAS